MTTAHEDQFKPDASQRDELLTALAMKIEKWPKTLEEAKIYTLVSPWRWFWLGAAQSICVGKQGDAINDIGGNHWLQRRTDLINEPDDSEAPEWADWRAQDRDGQWHWYEIKPSGYDSNLWMIDGDGFCEPASEGSTPKGHDWRATLTEIKRNTPERQSESRLADDRLQRDVATHKESLTVEAKQARYQDANGEDWIDEFARTSTIEEFRGAMRFTIGKYNRRAGKKDALISEIRKMKDYCARWEAYEIEREDSQ